MSPRTTNPQPVLAGFGSGDEPLHPAQGLGPEDGIDRIRSVASGCRACDLWERGTQTVFGEGPVTASLMLVGEQPGDREDVAGRPFVGPAGNLLDEALDEAGVDREQVFVTNAVKHFKWRPSGKRRLHEKPNAGEIRACRPWLDLELELVRPEILVLMGATAAQAVLGPAFRISRDRGVLIPADSGGPVRIATFHPSAILRAPDSQTRDTYYAALVTDLRTAGQAAGVLPA